MERLDDERAQRQQELQERKQREQGRLTGARPKPKKHISPQVYH